MNRDILVSINKVSRRYGNLLAIEDISFDVRRGEVLGFLGPNGAGKSTTMQIITGNLAPTSGSVLINGIDILERPKQAKASLGYLPEHPPLYKELRVDEFLSYCAKLHRMDKSRLRSAVEETKQRCGLDQVGKKLIATLSKGYQQRVGIAQAILHKPDVVILDEPTVGLDPLQIREIRSLIRSLGKDYSVILSTHILPEVQATCDRVQIINQGKIVLHETIEDLSKMMNSSSLSVAFRKQPSEEMLRSLDGVTTISSEDQMRWVIHHNPDVDPAEAIVELSVRHAWGLYELIPQKVSLEEIFINITHSDVPGPTKAPIEVTAL